MDDKPVRVAQMMTDMNYGGVEMVVMNYYKNIDRSKIQFDFFVFEGSSIPQKAEIESLGGRIFVVPKYTHILKYFRFLKSYLSSYQIVHSHMNTLSVFSLYSAKRAGVKNRLCHNHSTSGKGEFIKNFVKFLLRPLAQVFATDLFACSDYAGRWMYGKNTPFKVLNNAIDLEKFRYDKSLRDIVRKELCLENKKVIGHVGRFCYQKNHSLLIDIFFTFLKEQDAILMLIGEGELQESIKQKVKNLGIENNVIFLGKKKDIYRYYQAMDLFLLPSRYEGLPVVAIEAQASGLPCIISSNITLETKILNSTHFVSGGVEEYVTKIMQNICYDRKDAFNEMRNAGFDIKYEALKLQKYYEKLVVGF